MEKQKKRSQVIIDRLNARNAIYYLILLVVTGLFDCIAHDYIKSDPVYLFFRELEVVVTRYSFIFFFLQVLPKYYLIIKILLFLYGYFAVEYIYRLCNYYGLLSWS